MYLALHVLSCTWRCGHCYPAHQIKTTTKPSSSNSLPDWIFHRFVLPKQLVDVISLYMSTMESSVPTELAETIQASHIRHHPDPKFDNAPSTAADKRIPVSLHDQSQLSDDEELDDLDEDDIPYSVLKPARKQHNLPPLPDLRFEQSYLHSIANANTWWKVLLITARDQVSFASEENCPWLWKLIKGM